MTQDEIIEMAKESGMELYGLGKDRARFVHHLVAFTNLVAAQEREACALICERVYKRMCPEAQENEVGIEAEIIRARGEA